MLSTQCCIEKCPALTDITLPKMVAFYLRLWGKRVPKTIACAFSPFSLRERQRFLLC